jgi:GNAT superfamily N-acetyltransferase
MSLVRPALPAEASDAVRILAEAAAWANESGACAWSPAEFTVADYEAIARRGELIGGYDDDRMVACMRLEPHDPVYWADDPPGSALYVHKLAVSRAAAGRGWSRRLVAWAWEQAGRRGVPALKLDTLPEPRLLAHYESLGFERFDAEPRRFGPIHVIRMQRTG